MMISSGEIDESNVAAKVLRRSYPEKRLQCNFFPYMTVLKCESVSQVPHRMQVHIGTTLWQL